MDGVGVEGDASKSRTFLLSYLWHPVSGLFRVFHVIQIT